jgi:3,4-dihydroxy-9,10-secoandrosta-1,3,5(10)-triene-9,17-dione 4,5-dioxygenase
MMVLEGPSGELFLRMDERLARFIIEPSDDVGNEDIAIGWECRGEKAWDETRELLTKRGFDADPVEPVAWCRDSFVCRDPSGFQCEFFYGGAIEPIRNFVSPTGVTFVTEDQAMGHVTVLTPTYEDSVDFYEGILGFHLRESINTSIRASFLSPNLRQHSIGIVASEGPRQLAHVMVEVESLDSVGRAMDQCIEGAAPMTVSLGRHWNDHMTSFYLRTPAAFEVEYGYGGRTVDRATWARVEQRGIGGSSFWGHQIVRDDGSLGPQVGRVSG